jgi:hypothetical protein
MGVESWKEMRFLKIKNTIKYYIFQSGSQSFDDIIYFPSEKKKFLILSFMFRVGEAMME